MHGSAKCSEHCVAHSKGTINVSSHDGDDDDGDDDMLIILPLHPKSSLKNLCEKLGAKFIFLIFLWT